MLIKPLIAVVSAASFLAPVGDWQQPLEAPIVLVRHFLQPSSDYSTGHRGVDFEVQLEQTVFAPASGKILHAGRLVNRSLVSIDHGGGVLSEVEPVCSPLKPGDTVKIGQPIGFICAAEANYRQHCETQVCMHFSVRISGQYLSPLALIGGLSPSRLLPYHR